MGAARPIGINRPPAPQKPRNPQPKNPRIASPTRILLTAATTLLLLTGCHEEHTQSILHPASPPAHNIADLWWFMFWTLTAVFLITMLLLLVAIFRGRRSTDSTSADDNAPNNNTPARTDAQQQHNSSTPQLGTAFVVIAGIILPTIILLVILFVSVRTTVGLRSPDADITIEIIGHQWWWEVRYPDHDIVTANEIHIPAGQPVRLRVWAHDVVHSFWVPNLHGKIDMLPEHPNNFWIEADEPGEFRGQCAEYCGIQHALMAFTVIALPPDQFEQWIEHSRRPPHAPQTDLQHRGQQVFIEAGCIACHSIRGVEAPDVLVFDPETDPRVGPDLTHLGARRTLGAGTIANNRGNLGGWILNPQVIKPGNRMPRTFLEPNDLDALLEYFRSLE